MTTEERERRFEQLHAKHLNAMGTDYRESLGKVIEVVDEIRIFKVYFQNGMWWHYDIIAGTWY